MSLYSRLLSTSTNLIERYGVEYTFTKVTAGAFNPATGTVSSTSSTYTAYCVRDSYSAYERQDGSVQIDDIKLIAEVAAFAVDDTVSIDSSVYRVVRVSPIKPGATVLAYELQVRK